MDLTVGRLFRRLVSLSAVGSRGRRSRSPRLRIVSPEQVALIPCCVDCGLVWWPEVEDRFRVYLTDDEPPELAFLLSRVCAARVR